MTLADEVKEFKTNRAKVMPELAETRTILPIFRLNKDLNGLFKGNGFFLTGEGNLAFQYSTCGWEEPATPVNLYKAFRMFHQDIEAIEAMRKATRAIRNYYS